MTVQTTGVLYLRLLPYNISYLAILVRLAMARQCLSISCKSLPPVEVGKDRKRLGRFVLLLWLLLGLFLWCVVVGTFLILLRHDSDRKISVSWLIECLPVSWRLFGR